MSELWTLQRPPKARPTEKKKVAFIQRQPQTDQSRGLLHSLIITTIITTATVRTTPQRAVEVPTCLTSWRRTRRSSTLRCSWRRAAGAVLTLTTPSRYMPHAFIVKGKMMVVNAVKWRRDFPPARVVLPVWARPPAITWLRLPAPAPLLRVTPVQAELAEWLQFCIDRAWKADAGKTESHCEMQCFFAFATFSISQRKVGRRFQVQSCWHVKRLQHVKDMWESHLSVYLNGNVHFGCVCHAVSVKHFVSTLLCLHFSGEVVMFCQFSRGPEVRGFIYSHCTVS